MSTTAPNKEFTGKVVLVTGAASGLGAATAIEFARQGATLSLIDIDSLDETVEAIKNSAAPSQSGEITVMKTIGDLALTSVREDYVLRTVAELGRIDVLVNNAAGVASDTILNTTLETLDRVMNVNFRAVFHLCALSAPHLVKSKGNIVNVSSEYSDTINVNYLSFTLSKATVNQLSRSIAAGNYECIIRVHTTNLMPHGVRVNNIMPGAILTNLNRQYVADFPKVKWGEPQDAANLITFLASSKAKFITGSNVQCDGGFSLGY